MKIINILPPAVFNLLAAGEVVENPASVIKELTENSLDAGANQIEIAIDTGGLESMRVTDNGSGVHESQAARVFMPHATSKISSAGDIQNIATLGFRGEALSSIASVSRIEFITRTKDESAATKLISEAGKITSTTKTGANVGTSITVKNLFYNTPARKKFLASANSEKNNVTAAVQKLILSNPDVSFRYIIDDEVIYDYQSGSLIKAIEVIYGKELCSSLLPVKAEQNGLALHGFISDPGFTKKNRTWQTSMINGRIVSEGPVGDAVNSACKNYFTVGVFPFFVLDLSADPACIDVNVHPRKSAVKFSNETAVIDFIQCSITDTYDTFYSAAEKDEEIQQALSKAGSKEPITVYTRHFSSAGSDDKTAFKRAPNLMSLFDKQEEERIEKRRAEILDQLNKRKKPEQTVMAKRSLPSHTVLGTVFDTYILVIRSSELFIIDQHAAAERLLYDIMEKQINSGTVATQALLEPAIVVLNPQEVNKMTDAIPYLHAMGIECEVFGNNCFRITAVPVAVSERGIDTVICNVLKEARTTPVKQLSEVLREKIITECCKASLKAGKTINDAQIQAFLTQFENRNMTPLCPHGRPIVISLTKEKLEKLFSRK